MNELQQREFILHNLQDLGNYLRGIKRTMIASGLLTRAEVLALLQECRLTFQDPEAFDNWQRGAFFPHNPYEPRGKAFVPSLQRVLKPLFLNWRLTARHYKNGDLWFACRALMKTTELAWFVYGSVQHQCALKNIQAQDGGSKLLTLGRRQIVRNLLRELKPDTPKGWNNDYDSAVTAVGNAIEYMLKEDEGRKALSKTRWPKMDMDKVLRSLEDLLKPGRELYPLLAPSYHHLSDDELQARRLESLQNLKNFPPTPRFTPLLRQYTPEKASTSASELPSPE
ncbi:hypothetical protein [Aeromonas veronii]|uniref:hypothetical protein n=1 Tax=Aeromonas veronii TaxID=654 RepID=UPI003BA19D3C